MSPNGQGSLDSTSPTATDQEACAHRWVQVSWDELARLCLRLFERLRGADRPDVVVALARAGYVPGAILASLLRCDLLTLPVPAMRGSRRLAAEQSTIASLQPRLDGRRVVILDETTRTGESLVWAVRVSEAAGAVTVRTAVLFRAPGSPSPDYCAATAEGHVLQPWVRYYLDWSNASRGAG